MDSENAPKRPTNAAGQCLLLLPPGCEAPADLLGGLRNRGVQVREVNDAPAAMVALARERYLSLVIIEPDCLMQGAELAAAARRYHAATTVWRYAAEDEPRLMRWPAAPPLPAGEGRAVVSNVEPAEGGRKVGSSPATQQPAEPAPGQPSYQSPQPQQPQRPARPDIEITLSEDELAMLLADDDPPSV